jgi:UDP-GlcNAc:undecaprenyl-phosphate GlcNAc-1-phosphate transferase
MVVVDGALLALAMSVLFTILATRPSLRLAERFDLVDKPGQHKRHKRPVPVVGGLILFVGLWLAVALAGLLYPNSFPELRGSFQFVFAGSLIVTLVGFSDDLTPLTAWTKLGAQAAAGLVLYLGGLGIDPLTIPFMGSYDIGNWSALITILWVVGLTNAVNIIDGLDGLAVGVSLVGAITMAVIGSLYGVGSVALLSYSLIGFLAVFWWFNRYPARAFLGDSGALQIGFYFAVISLLVPIKSYTAAALYLPLLALGVPLLEVTVSITRRLASGKSVMQADRRHLFHYLALAGLSPRQVVAVFHILSVVFGLFAMAMYFWNRLVVFGLLVLFMVVIFALFFIFMANLGRPGRFRRGQHHPLE